MVIKKRDGTIVPFDAKRIEIAIHAANAELAYDSQASDAELFVLQAAVEAQCTLAGRKGRPVPVESVQNWIETEMKNRHLYQLQDTFHEYRMKRAFVRNTRNTIDDAVSTLIDGTNEELNGENSNKNPEINSTIRDYLAGIVSKDFTKRTLPEEIVQAHENGLIHFHDADYFIQHMHNCDLVNLEDMLQNGTVISGTLIEKPHSFKVACNVATQIVAQVASNQYGGQSISLAHLSPFVEISRQNIKRKQMKRLEEAGLSVSDEQVAIMVENELLDEIKDGIQTIQYQLVTLMTTNGQTPFVTVFLNLFEAPEGRERDDLALCIKEVLNQRIQGVKNEARVWVTPAFPKLIYMLDEGNMEEDAPYYWLTELAAKCTAKRMVPDYISAKVQRELKQGDTYTCMGCRSFLTVDRCSPIKGNVANAGNYREGEHKYYGRFNQGVVTLNLVDIALSSSGDMTKFWKVFDERLDLCYQALMIRHNRLKGTKSDVSPILWQHGALARLRPGETIDKLLYDGYSTISLGYAGLYECTKYMTGKSHTDPEEGKPFALEVMQYMNDACTRWKKQTNIDFSVYGTPIESTTEKFAKCLQKRFGIVEGITDHLYITNSYHVNVREEINAFDKLTLEAEFQPLSPGGAISYVEVPNMQGNIPAVMTVIRHIYENIMYAELNTKSDYCMCCGFDGEIKAVEDENSKELVWECPQCGNRDKKLMSVVRRTCGYLGSQYWCAGRTSEIRDRVLHL